MYLCAFVLLPQDGLRMTISFGSKSEYELDADTQDEKNKVNILRYNDHLENMPSSGSAMDYSPCFFLKKLSPK